MTMFLSGNGPIVVLAAAAGIAAILAAGRIAIRAADRRRAQRRRRQSLAPLAALKARIIGRKGEARVARRLDALRVVALHDVTLADERGVTQIDHVALSPHGLVVIETKNFSGEVRGDLDGEKWVRHRHGERFAFQNPLRQNYRHLKAVERAIGDRRVPVRGYILAVGPARFQGPLAHAVHSLDRLPEIFERTSGAPVDPALLEAAWSRLVRNVVAIARSPRLIPQVAGKDRYHG